MALPDGPAYFTSRGSALGQAPGHLVASAFAVFNPEIVVPCVEMGWSLTDAKTIADARTQGAVAQLVRILGEHPDGLEPASALLARAVEPLRPEGRPLFAGLLALGLPGDPWGDLWRYGDLLREFRGDAHTAAWTSAGFDATEIGLLTEQFWGVPTRTYVRTRAWSDAQLDAAEERLVAKGLMADGAFTEAGRSTREALELATDLQMRPAIEALGRRRRRVVLHHRTVGRGDPRGRRLSHGAGSIDRRPLNAAATSSANSSSPSATTPWRPNHLHTFITSRCSRSNPCGLPTRSTACGKSISNS